MAYFQIDYETLTNGIVTGTETVVLSYADSLSCEQGEALLAGQSEAAIVAARALCATVVPAVPAGKSVQARVCSGGSGDQINVIGDNSGYVQDGTTPTTDPGTPTNYDTDGELAGYVTV